MTGSRHRPARRPHAARVIRAAALAVLASLSACVPAHAADATVILPWGEALVSAAQVLTALLTPVVAAAVTAAAARFGGPLRLLITEALVERLVRDATDYALNAVAGAVRGRTLTIPLGSAVIAGAVQRALDEAPAWLVRAAGGPEGLAGRVFRALPLEDAASAGNTLEPALTVARGARPHRAV